MRSQTDMLSSLSRSHKTVIGALLLLCFTLLAVVAPVHHALHQDGDSGHCAACVLAKGQAATSPELPQLLTPVLGPRLIALAVADTVSPAPAALLPPGRAPPSV